MLAAATVLQALEELEIIYEALGRVGSNAGLLLFGDIALQLADEHELRGEIELHEGQWAHLAMQFVSPEELHAAPLSSHARVRVDLEDHLTETLAWWHEWAAKITRDGGPAGPA